MCQWLPERPEAMFLRFVLILLGVSLCFGQKDPPNPAYRKIKDVRGLPRVLLIGDSISIGYTVPVQKELAGKANVHRIPINGSSTVVGLRNVEVWLGSQKWDVIHFNFGLHDLKIPEKGGHQVPLAAYEKNLRRIVQRFKQTGARLIWATTTPIPDSTNQYPPRVSSDVVVYNAAARKIIEEAGVPIDDLYARIKPRQALVRAP
jgi:acyl-CoA thioesterase-1